MDIQDVRNKAYRAAESAVRANRYSVDIELGESFDAYRDRLIRECHEAEMNARQYSPFEFFAKDMNESDNDEMFWHEYNECVAESIQHDIRQFFKTEQDFLHILRRRIAEELGGAGFKGFDESPLHSLFEYGHLYNERTQTAVFYIEDHFYIHTLFSEDINEAVRENVPKDEVEYALKRPLHQQIGWSSGVVYSLAGSYYGGIELEEFWTEYLPELLEE